MSKAFTRESDDAPDEPLQLRSALPTGVQNYITAEGAEHLRNQLANLKEQKHLALQNRSAEESADAADVRKLENRLRQLQQILNSIIVALPPTRDPDRIAFGSTVTVRQVTGEELTYRIVGVDETNLDTGQISWRSPPARALLSRRAGDEVRFTTPLGTEALRILSVNQ